MAEAIDSITVAPEMLYQLLSTAIRAVPGVARLGTVPRERTGTLGGGSAGIALSNEPDGVTIDCYLVCRLDAPLSETGAAVQAAVAAVLREIVGAAVREVNVSIQDVVGPSPAGETIGHG